MHSNFLATIFLALCIAHRVMAAPLDTFSAEDPDPTKPKETENMERIASATKQAHGNVLKMEHVLNEPNKPANAAMIKAAFGETTPEDLKQIKSTVGKLKTGVVPVKLPSAGPGILAYTQYDNNMSPTHVEFGDKFHNQRTSDNARAATVVHEATHYLANTGDYIKNGEVLPGNDRQTSTQTAYAMGSEPNTTPAGLNSDPQWTRMRDGYTMKDTAATKIPPVKKLFQNAESFGQFSTMCGAAVSDQAVGLRRRAIEARDWDTVALDLVRRQACSIRSRPKGKTTSTTNGKLSSSAKTKISAASKLLVAKKSAADKKAAASLASKARGGLTTKSKGRTATARSLAKGAASARKPKTFVASKKSPLSKRPLASSKKSPLSKRPLTSSKKSPLAKRPLGSSKKSPLAKRPLASSKKSPLAKRPSASSKKTTLAKRPSASSKKTTLAKRPLGSSKKSPLSKRPLGSSKKSPLAKRPLAASKKSPLAKRPLASSSKKSPTKKILAQKAKTNSVAAKRPATKKQTNIARPAGNRGGSTPAAVKKTSQAVAKKAPPPPPPAKKVTVAAKKGRP